ncbi:hypothetical protein XU18_2248 [Perkinsela sp. CCAP 1560/4]|nr:hypothetical protein XU18_2248 [Perkinsela sp. CCAP 1560/4]|eukprot:KNH06977.1 hypothetical protein XU18_2248 [Perkinsela sp. CCAP 1560/4]
MSANTHKDYVNARKRLKVLLRSDQEDQEVRAEICTIVARFPEFSDAFPEVQAIVPQIQSTASMATPSKVETCSTIQKFVGFVSFCRGVSPGRKLGLCWFWLFGAICWLHQLELLGKSVEMRSGSHGCAESVVLFIYAILSPLLLSKFWAVLSAQWSFCVAVTCALMMHGTMQCQAILHDISSSRPMNVLRTTQDLMSFLIGDFVRILAVYFFFSGIFLAMGKSMNA